MVLKNVVEHLKKKGVKGSLPLPPGYSHVLTVLKEGDLNCPHHFRTLGSKGKNKILGCSYCKGTWLQKRAVI